MNELILCDKDITSFRIRNEKCEFHHQKKIKLIRDRIKYSINISLPNNELHSLKLRKITRRSIKKLQRELDHLCQYGCFSTSLQSVIPSMIQRFQTLTNEFDYLISQYSAWHMKLQQDQTSFETSYNAILHGIRTGQLHYNEYVAATIDSLFHYINYQPYHHFMLQNPLNEVIIYIEYTFCRDKQLKLVSKTNYFFHSFPCPIQQILQLLIRLFCLYYIGWDCSTLPEIQFYVQEQTQVFPYGALLSFVPKNIIQLISLFISNY